MPAAQSFSCFAVLCLASALILAGCGGGSKPSTTSSTPTSPTPTITYPSVTGNYGLTAMSTVSVDSTFPVAVYLTSSGAAVSGVAHLDSPCFALATNVPVSGTVSTSGAISLTSTAVGGQTLAIAGTISSGSLSGGTYSASGGCANGDKGTLTGSTYAAVSGTYSGSIRSVSGLTIAVTAVLTETSTVDSNGFFHLSGSATFAGSPCFSQTTIANPTTDTETLGNLAGVNFTPNPTTGAVIDTVSSVSSDGKVMAVDYQVAGGLCSGDYGTGSLTRQ